MRTLFIIPLVLMSLVSVPSWGLTMDDIFFLDGLFYEKSSSPKKEGETWEEYYRNSTIFTGEIDGGDDRGSIKNGKREGSWETYHDNGQLRSKGDFKNGKKEGSWETYHDNGQLEGTGTYRNDRKEGAWKFYHDNGQLEGTGTYKNNKKEGAWKFFTPQGTTGNSASYERYMSGTYKNGKKVSD